jgi:hypothetical protein
MLKEGLQQVEMEGWGMRTTIVQNRGYILAAIFGAVSGGIFVGIVGEILPKLMSEMMPRMMKGMMDQVGGDDCDPEEM